MLNKNIKRKVGIITFYHENYNFGGLLQAYALPKVLIEYFGIEAEQIDYVPSVSIIDDEAHEKEKKNLVGLCYQMIYKVGIFLFSKACEKKLQQRKHVFVHFLQDIPHSNILYTNDSIQKSLEQYSAYVCGGDQIWNPIFVNQNIEVYTLQFVPSSVKKIAYAPSIAVLDIPLDFKHVMSKGVNALDAVSVREKYAIPILKDFINQNIEVVIDPVLLMTEKQWEKEVRMFSSKRKYILCYLLGESIGYRNAVKQFARKLNLSVRTFPHIYYNVVRKCDLFFGDIHDYTSGPREFLGLIKNAEFVITDSFHACVFSMIFETPFVVLERNKIGEKGNMNSRIYDFLEEYHLENQLVSEKKLADMKEIPRIDFTYAHKHWEKRREESLKYLENALKDN